MILRNSLLVLGAVSLLSGITMSGLWLHQQVMPARIAAQEVPEPTSVLTAARPIAAGSLLRPDDLSWTNTVSDTVGAGQLRRGRVSQADYVGAIARRDFAAGEPLVADGLVKSSDRGFLAAALSPSHRAVTISVDASMSAAGLVLPGDKVDVILTQNFDDAAVDRAHRSVGETVLRDVRVIAVDNWLSGTPKLSLVEQRLGPSEGRGTKTVTLDVDEHDAEKLFVAMQIGKVELTVRALAVMQTPVAAPPMPAPTWAADVSPALNSLVRRPPPPPPAAVPSTPAPQAEAPRSRIEVMHGEKIEIR